MPAEGVRPRGFIYQVDLRKNLAVVSSYMLKICYIFPVRMSDTSGCEISKAREFTKPNAIDLSSKQQESTSQIMSAIWLTAPFGAMSDNRWPIS